MEWEDAEGNVASGQGESNSAEGAHEEAKGRGATEHMTEYQSKYCSPKNEASAGDLIYLMHGKPGSGKTTAACTISRKFPSSLSELLNHKREVYLDDIVVVEFDDDATIGLTMQYGITFKYRLNFKSILRKFSRNKGKVKKDPEFVKALMATANEVDEIIDKDPNVCASIHDTMTSMDIDLVPFLMNADNGYADVNGENETIKRSTYGVVAGIHHQYFKAVTTVRPGVATIFTFHQKVLEEMVQGKASAKKANELKQNNLKLGNATVNVVPQITGMTQNLYIGRCSQEFICVNTGKEYFITADPYMGQRAKNRFPEIIKGKQEPHLRKLIEKIDAECVA